MHRIWTEEDRLKQAGIAKAYEIWKHSTGPQSPEGKRTSSMNAWKHGLRSRQFIHLKAVIRQQTKNCKYVKQI